MGRSGRLSTFIQAGIALLLITAVLFLVYTILVDRPEDVSQEPPLLAALTPNASLTPGSAPTQAASLNPIPVAVSPRAFAIDAQDAPTPVPVTVQSEPPASSFPVSNGNHIAELNANPQRVGWVSKNADGATTASFPDYNIYAGVYADTTYIGALSFDLDGLDSYGPIVRGELLLTGLSGDQQRLTEGQWTLEVLAADSEFWLRPDFDLLTTAPAALFLAQLTPEDMAVERPARIALSTDAISLLNGLRYQKRPLSIRLRGPEEPDSLFGFDGGVGSGSRGNPPLLLLETGPVEPTPTPQIVTATPTPETVLTAAAQLAQATEDASRLGTATPTPFNQVVVPPQGGIQVEMWNDPQGTPLPVIVPTDIPESLGTAVAHLKIATAQALTTGTATPLPDRYVTATHTPTPVLIVATTTPENVMTLAAQLVQATADAERAGTPTPLPAYHRIITPTPRFIVVTATPFPANVATLQVQAAQATVQILLTGTPTPTPVNQVTATALPLLVPVSFFTPTPTSVPTVRPPDAIPSQLSGLILFFSDRTGKTELYALDSSRGLVYHMTQQWPYSLAQDALGLAPNGLRKAIVAPDSNQVLQIQIYSYEYGDTKQITTFQGTSYDPAWSSRTDQIAFVSTDSGNDEIYTVDANGSVITRLTHNTWEWDKHPSWSPDGSQIVFWSNRESGRRQLWLMNADGSGQVNVSNNEYNDWDPIWIR